MSAGKKRVSFGFSKLVKKPKVILPALKPAETVNFIKCVENNSVQVFDEVIADKGEELVIPMKPSSRLSDLKPKATDSSNNPVLDSKKLESLDELAAKELVAEANKLQKEGEETSAFVLPLVSNLLAGEKESTLEDYKSIPIKKYGLAMLRGMGWEPGKGIGWICCRHFSADQRRLSIMNRLLGITNERCCNLKPKAVLNINGLLSERRRLR